MKDSMDGYAWKSDLVGFNDDNGGGKNYGGDDYYDNGTDDNVCNKNGINANNTDTDPNGEEVTRYEYPDDIISHTMLDNHDIFYNNIN